MRIERRVGVLLLHVVFASGGVRQQPEAHDSVAARDRQASLQLDSFDAVGLLRVLVLVQILLERGVRGDALAGFLQVAFAQPGARLGVGLVHLVFIHVAPRDGLGIQQLVPPFELDKRALHGRDAARVRAEFVLLVIDGIERRVDELVRAEDGSLGHPKLLLNIGKVGAVVGVVPVVERKREAGFHVLLLDTRGRIHGERRLVPHAHDGVDVSRHVLGVADARHQIGVCAAACERLFGFVVIPVVDAVVVRARMVGFARQDFADDQFGAIARVAHGGLGQQRARFHIVRILHAQRFELLHLGAAQLAVIGLGPCVAHRIGQQDGRFSLDIQALALGDFVLALDGFAQEVGGAVAFGGAGQAPIGHGVVRLQFQAPTEGALGFVKPEGVQQRVALVEPLLDLGVPGGDGKRRDADALDQPRLLARPDVERDAMRGVAFVDGIDLRVNAGTGGECGRQQERAGWFQRHG